MATRIRTLNFLPEIFQTPSNAQFLAATLDQLVAQPAVKRIEGYVGSKFGYGINANDYYVTEPTKTRIDYQLDPGVVFTKENESVAQDFISYPGILDALKLEGALTNDNNRLFNSDIYSWDSFTNLDKIINFNQYYWLPEGPEQVVVSSEIVYSTNDYIVTDLPNNYLITADGVSGGSANPTLTLLRGGTYTFLVDQDTGFWIQGAPGTTGYSPTQPNLDTRAVYGVSNNGASNGFVSFSVPRKNAQDEYNFPGNNLVGVVSTRPFSAINGARLSSVGDIDGLTALEGLTVMFYSTGIASEIGFISNFYDTTTFDVNNQLVADQTVSVTATSVTGNLITCSSTENLRVDNTITFTGNSFGGIAPYSESLPDTLYYITSIITSTQFTVSRSLGGADITLTDAVGSMVGSINQGLYEEGFYTTVNQTFYTITYVGDPEDPVLRLIPAGSVPTNQKITAQYGTQLGSRNFFKNILGSIILIPYISAPLDTLYYQDSSSSNKVGVIKLIDSNFANAIDVEKEILGKKTYTSSTGIVFTNGLKISFQGDIIPASYKSGQYYVEGVGTAIELVLISDLISPEPFTLSTLIPWDTVAWDTSNWDGNSYIPITPDYITISRNAICKNAWSRSNRWFHTDVITQTAKYNNDPESISLYATAANKAKRPIIEFYPNLRLFNSGSESKAPVDFIDFRSTDAFSQVAGKQNYYPDVTVYTAPTSTIASTNYATARTATATASGTNIITCDSTLGFRVNDLVVFNSVVLDVVFGGVVAETNYYISEIVDEYNFKISASKSGVVFPLTTGPVVTGRQMRFYWTPRSVEITVNKDDTTGIFSLGQYITDMTPLVIPSAVVGAAPTTTSTNLIPTNAIISSITTTLTTIVLEASWDESAGSFFAGSMVSSIIATDTTSDNYALFDGARVIFAMDTTSSVKNKIYVARFSTINELPNPVITLTEASDSEVLADQQTVVLRGYAYHGQSYYFDGIDWKTSQFKSQINQPPQFDVFDNNGKSFGDTDYYIGTSFTGNPLFAYGLGSGLDDIVLGFPLRYSSIDNIGDISFDVSVNTGTFDYVSGSSPINQKVNTGYVYNYKSRSTYKRELGWQTAVSPSIQYQIFDFKYNALNPSTMYTCDIAAVDSASTNWPTVQVYVNNIIQSSADYTISVGTNSTTITLAVDSLVDTVVQILVLSNQVSKVAYYEIPVNLSNNPLNADITVANIGDIRGQYQSIFYNNPNTTGSIFGSNNYRDLGNVVPYGNRIIQNSASLVLPGTFLRKQNHNLFNSLVYNNREYIKFKTLLIDTVNSTDYAQRYDPSYMLDDALDIITSYKTEEQSFFWSDMLPSKAAYITNSYSFANSLDVSIYPLSRVYDFSKANYYGVLVYLTRTTNSLTTVTQLIINQDYIVSSDAPSLTVTLDLLPDDKITIKEYKQTYGSYVPNTPTKMGLFPATVPKVILDSDYLQPTYFIRGHDGSYTKLYGDYNPSANALTDFRDQVLLEYELRVFNNLKLSALLPIQAYEILPGYFRNTGYSYDEFLEIYGTSFLDWVGQNRINYKRQLYNKADQFTYNYYQTANKLDNTVLSIGYWRGIYQYYYDTTAPNITPWEMLGFTDQPSWWESRYGVAPYTSDNLVLWDDLAKGINWNNGIPVVITNAIRPELLKVLPVDSAGNLVPPLDSVVGNYNSNIFQRDWKVGDGGPAELSYRRSSSWPFDLMRILAVTKPAEFFNLGVDLDNYKYNAEFNQYLVNNRHHLVISDIELYGSGTAKTSYLNWIIDYEKQIGVDATTNITTLLDNLDVRLVYRLAGFSDKNILKFYVEKGTPNSKNASLLIPDESYSVLLYDNQPFTKVTYSGVVIQNVNNGFAIYGNSQSAAYFKTLVPKLNGNDDTVTIEDLSVRLASDYTSTEVVVPYGTIFYSVAEVSQFLASYGAYLQSTGMVFAQIENGIEITWKQMVAEFLYWAQTGWEEGSVITLNPSAGELTIDKDGYIVQPLTMRETNFVLNQNLYPIQSTDLNIVRDGTSFIASTLNSGDSISYGQFNIHNIEHGIVFDNVTLFNDIIYNLISGLRQTRIAVRGTKTADWNGSVTASGFILNQDNILEWNNSTKYTKGSIVKYKNKYWTALKIIQIAEVFDERYWKRTEYDQIQKGLLPNSSTRSYESSLYYDSNKANLEQDADLLSFSLIGYRPRDYLALADLTDITQINVYKNLIKSKGTLDAASAFKGANLPQGGIDYEIYENWAIKSGEFGGVLNSNFAEFKISESIMTGNPSIVGLTKGVYTDGVQQEIPLYSLFNYGRPITNPDILPQLSAAEPSNLFPDAGYVNFNDVKMSSFYFSQLQDAVDQNGIAVPITDFYVRDYVWLANYLGTWQAYTPVSIGRVISASNNLNDTVTLTFETPHNLVKYQPLAVVNFSEEVDGYYTVVSVVNINSIVITLAIDPSVRSISGAGTGLRFQSQRVETPADIANLPLLGAEFVKNTVWVDTNDDGNWAVYRKSINYQYESEMGAANSKTFGSAVAVTPRLGYLIGDAAKGTVTRYTYNDLSKSYQVIQKITNNVSFGATIKYAGDIFVISEPAAGAVSPAVGNLNYPNGLSGYSPGQPYIAPTFASPGQPYIAPTPYDPGQPYIAPIAYNPGQPYIAPIAYNPGQPYIAPTPASPGQPYIAPVYGNNSYSTPGQPYIAPSGYVAGTPQTFAWYPDVSEGQQYILYYGNNTWSGNYRSPKQGFYPTGYQTEYWMEIDYSTATNIGENNGQQVIQYLASFYYRESYMSSVGTDGYYTNPGQAYIAPTSGGGTYLISAGQPYIAPTFASPGQPYIAPTPYNPGQPYIAPTLAAPGQPYIAPTPASPGQPYIAPTPYDPGQAYIAPVGLPGYPSGLLEYVSAVPSFSVPKVHVYQLLNTPTSDDLAVYQAPIEGFWTSINWGKATAISGDGKWLYISDCGNPETPNRVYVYRKSQITGEFIYASYITTTGLADSDNFGHSISTDYYGSTVVIGAPNQNFNSSVDNWGYAYVFDRVTQNLEAQFNSNVHELQQFKLEWTPPSIATLVTALSSTTNILTCDSTEGFTVDAPVIFSGVLYTASNVSSKSIYYVESILSSTTFTIKQSRDSTVPVNVGTSSGVTMIANVQTTPVFVEVNGTLVNDNEYAIVSDFLYYVGALTAGDIITISGQQFTLVQKLTTEHTPKVGVQFGISTDTNVYASEIIVGAPFELNDQNQEGAVYRYTNGGAKYGIVIGTSPVNITATRKLLINGFIVYVPVGHVSAAVTAINAAQISNVIATVSGDNLIISMIDSSLANPNRKLVISSVDPIALIELGIVPYVQTQTINCPHIAGPTQFGAIVKFNESGSFVASAPTGTRFAGTTFDFTDDENLDNDTVFDNNSTQWVDMSLNAGAVYMFDYLARSNESLSNSGNFVYAQSLNARNEVYGSQPNYGQALDFNDHHVLVGTPTFRPDFNNGQVVVYNNQTGIKDWSVFRRSAPIVDVSKIQNAQLFSAETNNTLINFDYIDPLQGKLLGAVSQNIDVISNVDPAKYNNTTEQAGLTWGAAQVGQLWFNTSTTRFINYHQNDVAYNSQYWATVFPGSDVSVYSWISSSVLPVNYAGPGTPYDIATYSIRYELNATGALTPLYFYWVRNTNLVFANQGKTLADSTIQSYIAAPKNSGVSYFAPLLPNVFGLYNSAEYINSTDSVMHIGFSTGTTDDVAHNQFSLIRSNYADDFLPGIPSISGYQVPESLYNRMLDSLCGVDDFGAVVPNPFLPRAVQYGILARPRQSFFINRFVALQNYLQYANEVLSQNPITETKQYSFLFSSGDINPSTSTAFFDTGDGQYWEYIDWWATGYNNNTKSVLQVAIYTDLATLNVLAGTIVTVVSNGNGKTETYIFTAAKTWSRIGLTNGTIKIKSALWDYAGARLGFGDNFFDTTPYDQYPSEETRRIIRGLNEQIYTDELLIHRNKSLILLFEYIQSETFENQNYLPWLNKTSFIDVAHTIRELKPIEVFQSDNQDFLAGYLNEVKPYHVIIKEFLFKYTGNDTYDGNITDFDLPASYDSSIEQFISPELVYANPSSDSQFLASDPIWEDEKYSAWFNAHGLSITGQTGVQITTLASYLVLNSNEFAVENASGFPINGVVLIGDELIAYASVDRAFNLLSGLTRGINGTPISAHLPGELLYIDLPAVLLLDGGRGYSEPPKVIAHIDTTIYPAPTRAAVLVANLSVDSVLSVEVIDPGQGYAVLPEIRIDAALSIVFDSSDVTTYNNTIQLYAPLLQTGDLALYKSGTGTPIGGLKNNQWYYINVLETVPTVTIALYNNARNAVFDQDRIQLYTQGTGSDHTLNVGAKASCITSAAPVRENTVTLRFDRTSYNSRVVEWTPSVFYSSIYAGAYSNSDKVASSSIQLQSTHPTIASILASAQGVAWEIVNTRNEQTFVFSSLLRQVGSTVDTNDAIRLIPLDDGSMNSNASGSTIGFYVGMPIKFKGAAIGGIVNDIIYYVHSVLNETDFTISATPTGSVIALTAGTVSPAGLACYTGDVLNQAVLTVNYPGLMSVTNTYTESNALTIPVTILGTGGTLGFYTNLPVFFTGDMFGGVIENQIYYITTVIDSQSFTMSETKNPIILDIVGTVSVTNLVISSDSAYTLSVNDPVIFTGMVVGNSTVTNFGNIIAGTVYYVSSVIGDTTFKISSVVNGDVIALTDTVGTAVMTNQKDDVKLTTASGDMTINVALPVSPGQVNGQEFTLYETSDQIPNLVGTNSNLITRDIGSTLSGVNRVALTAISGGTTDLYVNMPITVAEDIGGLTVGTTYFVTEMGTLEANIVSTSPSIPVASVTASITGIVLSVTAATFGTIIIGSVVIGAGVADNTIVLAQVGPQVGAIGNYIVSISQTISSETMLIETSALTCDSTASLYETMPIVFSGTSLGGIELGSEYYVKHIINSSQFVITNTPSGAVTVLGDDNGPMVCTGSSFVKVSTVVDGTAEVLTTQLGLVTMTQAPTSIPEFSASYMFGGYRAAITIPGSGYALDNTITISGSLLGGTTPTNNLIITVSAINSIGEITSVICDGVVPAGTSTNYYLKVVSANEFEVYTDALMTIPAPGVDFQYSGATSTTVTSTSSVTDAITVESIAGFQINDEVTFTGAVVGGLILSNPYYILSLAPLTVSTVPGLASTLVQLSTSSQSFTMAKAGSYLLLPEPFYFDQSIVKFNNQAYICLISNNDSEFIFGKWKLLHPSDRRLNALDRIMAYYQPSINMPGLDLSQLVDGIIYPNGTYLGNAFAPADQFEIDTILQDQAFYPTEVDVTAITWDGNNYLAAANAPEYSCVISSPTSEEWSLNKLANALLNVTDIIYAGGVYIITTTNAATPIIRSVDGITWTTNGQYTPYDSTPYDTYPYDLTSLKVDSNFLNSVGYLNGRYVAVGENIVYSDESYMWNESYKFTNGLVNQFYGVAGINTSAFTGFVVVGKGQEYEYSTGISLAENRNLICISSNGLQWNYLAGISTKGLYGITSSNSRMIAVGEDGFICTSINGSDWQGVNETAIVSVNASSNVINISSAAGFVIGSPVRFSASFNVISSDTTYYIVEIVSATQIKVSTTVSGSPITLNTSSLLTKVYMNMYPVTGALNDVLYAASQFMAVGQNGLILTSADGFAWETKSSSTIEHLRGVTYNSSTNSWVVVGDNNTILISSDNGTTWNSSSVLTVDPSTYTVQGDAFTAGYGPEELVPGAISDSLTMIVATRPGTNWTAAEYGHVGYRVHSVESTPTSVDQTIYSFDGAVQTPSQLSVSIINGATGLSYSIYQPAYSVDWINSTITLASPLAFSVNSDRIRIDVYEPGNGNQLVKANTKTDPIRYNTTTGWSEIYVDCNYSETSFNGSGVIRPNTDPKDAIIILSNSATNTLKCDDVSNFVLNEPITFQGTTFGGIQEDVTYYVKTISMVSNTISVSDVFNLTSGIAGATFELTDAIGEMYAVIQVGYGLTWSSPLIYHNGTKLVSGHTGTVTRTSGTTNTVTCNTTSALLIGTPMVFSDTMFGGIILPKVVYNILTIVDANEFTLEDPDNLGNPLVLTDATGGAKFIADDYAFGITENGVSAKIIFSKNYDASVDYLAYTLFGESSPDQYGYTIPETELFIGDGVTTVFSLSNYVGSAQMTTTGIVELNGVRQTATAYDLDFVLDTVTFVTPPAIGDSIAVTTFNILDRQYMNTQYGITGNTVANIINVQNSIAPFIATTNIIATTAGTNAVTCVSTAGFIVDQMIQFSGLGFGGLNDPEGTIYYIATIISSTDFTVKDEFGNIIVLTTSPGLMVAHVGGLQAIRVTTGIDHNLQQNTVIRIDGTVGSVQLNDQTFYARVLNSTQFDLYEKPYDPAYASTNYPVTYASSYVNGGYAWATDAYGVITTTATATSASYNAVIVASTRLLIPNTPVIFNAPGLVVGDTTLGGLVVGTTYYVKEVSAINRFTVSVERNGSTLTLTDSTGAMNVTQWEQDNPDRLWVTVNGYRVQSSSIKLNLANYVSILTTILPTDEVIITSMIPSATPGQEIYLLNVNQKNEASVYRANTQTRTWLVKPLLNTDSVIYFDDITRITDTVVQSVIAPVAVDNVMRIGLTADKNIISSITVLNNTTGEIINNIHYVIKVEELAPTLVMTAGAWVSTGDSLTITIVEGNLIYLNGEQIRFSDADLSSNTLSGLVRGTNGTGVQVSIPLYSEAFGILSSNRMTDIQYNQTWNSAVHNTVLGDPLQISITNAAIFLNRDIP